MLVQLRARGACGVRKLGFACKSSSSESEMSLRTFTEGAGLASGELSDQRRERSCLSTRPFGWRELFLAVGQVTVIDLVGELPECAPSAVRRSRARISR